jgi:hypothetical protein
VANANRAAGRRRRRVTSFHEHIRDHEIKALALAMSSAAKAGAKKNAERLADARQVRPPWRLLNVDQARS